MPCLLGTCREAHGDELSWIVLDPGCGVYGWQTYAEDCGLLIPALLRSTIWDEGTVIAPNIDGRGILSIFGEHRK